MRLGIVGGKLQGTEAAYLAAKAGYETVLVDRRETPPAAGLADRHVLMDVTADEARSRAVLATCDAVLPACEDDATLVWLHEHVPRWDVPLLFDLNAYRTTASKLASNALFARLGVPRPRPWPEAGFPLVVKPDGASGSEGVAVAHDEDALAAARAALRAVGHEAVVEEFVAGPSLSLEVFCWGGRAAPLQVTGLEFDEGCDCKRVVAPVEASDAVATDAVAPGTGAPGVRAADAGAAEGATALGQATAVTRGAVWSEQVTASVLAAFDGVSVTLAEGLGLRGLMDVEVVVHEGQPKVLEIDARLPSQTPTAVFWSSGLNIVDLLVRTFREGALPAVDREPRYACAYEHVRASGGRLTVTGEHIMGSARPLTLVPGFFGVDEALTDYTAGRATWAATLIARGTTVAEARRVVDAAVSALAAEERLELRPEGEGP